jgi:hypothetical protein
VASLFVRSSKLANKTHSPIEPREATEALLGEFVRLLARIEAREQACSNSAAAPRIDGHDNQIPKGWRKLRSRARSPPRD